MSVGTEGSEPDEAVTVEEHIGRVIREKPDRTGVAVAGHGGKGCGV
jgi:hypothetical protein